MAGNERTRIVRSAERAIFAALSSRLSPSGFSMTRARFWTRPREHWVEVVHLHRGGISYGVPSPGVDYRVHGAIRVLNDPFEAVELNGPNSDHPPLKGYHLSCRAGNESTFERCVKDLARYCEEIAEPWFARFRTAAALLEGPDTPLGEGSRQALQRALKGWGEAEALARSRKLLGLV